MQDRFILYHKKLKLKFSFAIEVKSREYLLFSPHSIIKCCDVRIREQLC